MTRSIAKAKPTLKHLMVLKRMVDENLGFSMSSGYGISTSMTFFSTSTYEFIDGSTYWFDNNIAPLNTVAALFYDWGWVIGRKTNGIKYRHISNGSRSAYVLSELAIAYWTDSGKDLFDKLHSKAKIEFAKIDRMVIVKPKHDNDSPEYRNAGMLAQVIGKTPTRLYVDIVSLYSDKARNYEYVSMVGTKKYITSDQIFIDDATKDQFEKIVAAENIIVADRVAIYQKMRADIKRIRDQFKDRMSAREEYYDRLMGDN